MSEEREPGPYVQSAGARVVRLWPEAWGLLPQSLDDALRDLSAAVHRDLSEKQALSYSLSFPPTKLELCATRPEGTDSFIFEFPHPDARLGFEQAFDEAKRKLGEPGFMLVSP